MELVDLEADRIRPRRQRVDHPGAKKGRTTSKARRDPPSSSGAHANSAPRAERATRERTAAALPKRRCRRRRGDEAADGEQVKRYGFQCGSLAQRTHRPCAATSPSKRGFRSMIFMAFR
jgi:hypothetical protein